MATLRDAINIARQEPTSQRSMQLMAAIHAGIMDNQAAQEGIDLSQFKQTTAKHIVNNATDKTHPLIQKLGKFLANPEGAALDVAKSAAPAILESAVETGKKITPEQHQADLVAEKQREAQRANIVSRQQAATQKANKYGVAMPSSLRDQEGNEIESDEALTAAKEEFANKVQSAYEGQNPTMALAGRIGEAAGQSLQQGAEGLKEMATAGKDTVQMAKGFGKVANAPLGVVTSPLSGAVSMLPEQGQEAVNTVMQAPANLAATGLKEVLKPENAQYTRNIPGVSEAMGLLGKLREAAGQNPNIDVESEEYKQGVEEPFKNAINWMMLRGGAENAPKIGDVASKVGEAVKSTGEGIVNAPKAISDVAKRAQGKATGNIGADLRNLGVSEQHSGVLEARPDLASTAASYVQRGIDNLKNMAERKSTFEAPANEVLKARNSAKTQLREIGQGLDDIATRDLSNKKIDISNVHNSFNALLEDLGIDKTVSGGLKNSKSFSNAKIIDSSPVAEAIKELDTRLKNTSTLSSNLTESLSGNLAKGQSVLNLKKAIDSIVDKSQNSKQVRAVLSPIIDELRSTIENNASSAYKAANADYSALKTALDKIDKAGTYTTSKGKTGFSAQQMLKRSLKEGSPIYREALDAFKELEDRFGIEAPKDINYKAVLADMAEKLTKSAPTKSFEQVVPSGKLGAAVKAGSRIKEILSPSKRLQENALKVLQILEGQVK